MIYLVQFSRDATAALKNIGALYEITDENKYYILANENQLFALDYIEWVVEAVNQDPSTYQWEPS